MVSSRTPVLPKAASSWGNACPQNLLIEVSPVVPGGFVGQPLQVDNAAPGALFGIAATVDASGNQIIYFNDDNDNAVMRLGPIASATTPTTPGY
jgi:hypothetical protein